MWPVWARVELLGRPLLVTGYGVFAILAAVLATCLCVASARRFAFAPFDAFAASALAVGFGLLGAKALFLLVSLPRILEAGFWPFLAHGGLVWYGGLIGGAAAVLTYLRAYRLDVARFSDLAAPALAVGHAVGRLGCFVGGCCWGRPSTLPWAVTFPPGPYFQGPDVPLHPVQLYESAAELGLAAVAFLLPRLRARSGARRVPEGATFAVWLAGYGAVRLVMGLAFRGDDRGGGAFGWPPSALLSVAATALGLGWLTQEALRSLTTEKKVV